MRAPCRGCGFRLDVYRGLCQRCELENAARLETFDIEQHELDRRYPPDNPWAELEMWQDGAEQATR